jgi:hypothetical protein
MSAWPFLRQKFYYEIIKKTHGFNSKLRTMGKLQLLKNAMYGIDKLYSIRKFDYLFFNNADKRTMVVNNAKYDVFFDAWADKLGQNRSLFVEWAIKKHCPKRNTYSENVISDLVFKFGCILFSYFGWERASDLECLNEMKQKYHLEFNIEKELRTKLGEVRFYRFLFKVINPKAVFLISSFTKVSLVVAAHRENIKVYEAQHGFIGDNHQFYNSYHDFGQLYYPDRLIAFGNKEKTSPGDYFIFKPNQVIPVGSLYLENIKTYYRDNHLCDLTKQYDKVFCVALQTVREKELLDWIRSEAAKNRQWLFILKPRNYEYLDYTKYTNAKNIILLPNYNVYEILKYSDYNITIYSTVAVEAAIFGVKTLFLNIEGLSLKYFNVNQMLASLIDCQTGTIGTKELESPTGCDPYFIMGYYENVKNTDLF